MQKPVTPLAGKGEGVMESTYHGQDYICMRAKIIAVMRIFNVPSTIPDKGIVEIYDEFATIESNPEDFLNAVQRHGIRVRTDYQVLPVPVVNSNLKLIALQNNYSIETK